MLNEDKNIEKAIYFINQSDFEEAIKFLELEIKKNSINFRTYYLLGTCYLKVNKLDLAEKNLISSINLNQKMSSAIHNLGITFSLKKNFSEATKQFLKVLELEPENIETLIELGRNYELSHKFVDAENAYKKVLNIDPNNKTTNGLLGRMLINIGFHKKGLYFIRKSKGLIRFNDNNFKIIS